jgi:hypothetical protein
MTGHLLPLETTRHERCRSRLLAGGRRRSDCSLEKTATPDCSLAFTAALHCSPTRTAATPAPNPLPGGGRMEDLALQAR